MNCGSRSGLTEVMELLNVIKGLYKNKLTSYLVIGPRCLDLDRVSKAPQDNYYGNITI